MSLMCVCRKRSVIDLARDDHMQMLVPSEARDEGMGRRALETRHCHPAGEHVRWDAHVPSGQRLATRPEAEPKCYL